MRLVGIGLVTAALAFLLGMSGLPGAAVSNAAGWFVESGSLHGPVGDAVLVAFPELDGADPVPE